MTNAERILRLRHAKVLIIEVATDIRADGSYRMLIHLLDKLIQELVKYYDNIPS